MITLSIRVDPALQKIRRFHLSRTQLQPALKEFGVLMIQRTKQTFDVLAHGGSYRGVTWAPFAPSSMGRKRPSGKRITPQSKLLRDTGQLRASIVHGLKIDDSGMHLAAAKDYAAAQQSRRPFLFFETPRDVNDLRGIIMRRFGRING